MANGTIRYTLKKTKQNRVQQKICKGYFWTIPIVSFAEYLKKKNKVLTVDSKFVEALGDDIKNRPELIEWFQFQNAFHKHKLFLYG